MPDEVKKAEIELQAVLPKQVCVLGVERVKEKFSICKPSISALLLSLHCSLKGQEQVQCKFYNELGRILVKDFPSVPQLEEIPGEPEERNFPAYTHPDMGKLSFSAQEDRLDKPNLFALIGYCLVETSADKESIELIAPFG